MGLMRIAVTAAVLLAGLVAGGALLGRETRAALPDGIMADRILVEKSQHRLTLYKGEQALRHYTVSLGRGGTGPKRREGDRLTPEGHYTIDWRKPDSDYHRALHISYPNAEDTAQAAAAGVPPGSEIMLHGLRNGFGWIGTLHRRMDWTLGCIAVTNAEIEEIWRLVPDGTPITILP